MDHSGTNSLKEQPGLIELMNERNLLWLGFVYFLVFVFMTSFGEIILVKEIYLFGDIYLGKMGIGRQSANSLYLFLPLAGYLIYQKGWPTREFTRYEKIAFVFFGFLILHLLWAHYPSKAKKAPRYFFLCMVCFYATLYFIDSKKRMIITLAVFMAGAVIIAVVNLYQFFVLGSGLIDWHWSWKSFLASYMALNICLCLFFFIHIKAKWFRVLIGVA